ncbi:hypothetical protein [Neobacillus jeddahensis]|nr:hypothetical protein [Neobacillus jeddahensis]
MMEQKPMHFDGSGQIKLPTNEALSYETFEMTDEMRINIGRNLYSPGQNE